MIHLKYLLNIMGYEKVQGQYVLFKHRLYYKILTSVNFFMIKKYILFLYKYIFNII